MHAVDSASSQYVYASADDEVKQVTKSGGTVTSFSYTAAANVEDIEVGPENYGYIDDGDRLTILDPADGSVVHRHQFDNRVYDIEVGSGVAYVVIDERSVKKLEISGLS
jgi:hypothetical protein